MPQVLRQHRTCTRREAKAFEGIKYIEELKRLLPGTSQAEGRELLGGFEESVAAAELVPQDRVAPPRASAGRGACGSTAGSERQVETIVGLIGVVPTLIVPAAAEVTVAILQKCIPNLVV